MKTSELSGNGLSYWVARAEGHVPLWNREKGHWYVGLDSRKAYSPTDDWLLTGPLIAKYAIAIQPDCHMDEKDKEPGVWYSDDWNSAHAITYTEMTGSSPQEVICRMVVRQVYGDEVVDPYVAEVEA